MLPLAPISASAENARSFAAKSLLGRRAARLLERDLPEGFLVSHFGVLNHLVRLGDGRTPLSIARAFQVPKTTMTHTLAGLERAGLIRFAPNPRDGRSKCVQFTEADRRFRDDAVARAAPALAALAAEIDPDRIARTLPLLAEVREHLDRERDGETTLPAH